MKKVSLNEIIAGIPAPQKFKSAMQMMDERSIGFDAVNHPSHYTDGKIEVIDFIEDKKLDMHTGNAVKYICRAGKKDPSKEVEDLRKAVWYLSRKISNLEKCKR